MPEKSQTTKPQPSELDKDIERIKAKDLRKDAEAKIIRDKAIEAGCLKHTGQRFDVIKNPVPGLKDILSCPECRKEEEQRQEAERLRIIEARRRYEEIEAERAFENRTEAADIPSMFKNCALNTYRAESDGQKKALEIVSAFISKPLTEAGPGLLMRGNNGNGKTHLATAAMNDALKKGHTALYTRCWHIFNEINDARNDPARSLMAQVKVYTDPDILVIDELGVQSETPFELKALTDIFDTRYAALKPTIICGNADKAAVDKLLGLRILDRYAGGGQDIRFNWDSYRRKEGKNEG
jgi:DNA replication protein DnaC